ncbi:hypothetical protein EDC02_0163 [Micromonospora sp. Llam0]|uniref:hypothetical protein n=1 Tax=Micromonospora sp. Llam0 TaxID=2485143 RepID=UPI000F923EDC|nr:hypothetical protein [Micromonospora sp. Llam0]ROO58408.1 hypothetical protein EDC02_0163 [Micromonospora sp. Llam0]
MPCGFELGLVAPKVGLVAASAAGPVAVAGLAVGMTWAVGRAADALIERQQRVLAANFRIERAADRYQAVRRWAERARAEFGSGIDLPSELPRRSAGADLARADTLADDLLARTAAAEQTLHAQLGAARARRIVARVRAAIADGAVTSRTDPGPDPALGSPGPGRQRMTELAELGESLHRILSRLDAGASDVAVRQLEQWAEQALRAPSPATARRLLDDLRHSVDKANQEVAARRARLDTLAAPLRERVGPAVTVMHARLAAAADDPRPDWPGLTAAIDAALADARAAADHVQTATTRTYTAWSVRESLQQLGYTAEQGFDDRLAGDGTAHLTRPDWQDLAVRVVQRPGDPHTPRRQDLHLDLVAPRDSEPDFGPAVRDQWQTSVAALTPALQERGFDVRVDDRGADSGPHVHPVDGQAYPFDRADRSRRDRRHQPRLRERRP